MSDTAGAAADDVGQQTAEDAAAAVAANADDKGAGADAAQQAASGDDKGGQVSGVSTSKAAGDDKSATWRADIADEKARKFSDGFTSIEDLAKYGLSSRQKLGKALVIPGDDADEKEVAAYRKQMGVPESADGYKYALPNDLPEAVTEAITPDALKADLEMAHELGFSQAQVEKMMGFRVDQLVAASEALDTSLERAREQSVETLRKEWGDDFKVNSKLAVRAAEEFGGSEFVDFLAKTMVHGEQLANNPVIVKAFASIGRRMMEAKVHIAPGSDDRQSMDDRRDELTQKIHAARAAGDSTLAAKYDKERGALTEQIYGTGDIVGREGRGA